jgi:hypothetical protein
MNYALEREEVGSADYQAGATNAIKHSRTLTPKPVVGMAIDRVGQLADSVEVARRFALALLDEGSVADEPPLEVVFVETRADMQRLAGLWSEWRRHLSGVVPANLDAVRLRRDGC